MERININNTFNSLLSLYKYYIDILYSRLCTRISNEIDKILEFLVEIR